MTELEKLLLKQIKLLNLIVIITFIIGILGMVIINSEHIRYRKELINDIERIYLDGNSIYD